jgi:hypothetical protein
MSVFLSHFEHELELAHISLAELDHMAISTALTIFSDQGHSGFSANILHNQLTILYRNIPAEKFSKENILSIIKEKAGYDRTTLDARKASLSAEDFNSNITMEENTLDIIDAIFGHPSSDYHTLMLYFIKAVRRFPLSPLTGEDHEWSKINWVVNTYQNIRYGSVFKEVLDGRTDYTCYDQSAKVVYKERESGATYTEGGKFQELITFPYIPPFRAEMRYEDNNELIRPAEYL